MDIPQRGGTFAPQFYSQRVSSRSWALQNICKQSLQQSILNPVLDLMNQNVQCVLAACRNAFFSKFSVNSKAQIHNHPQGQAVAQ